MSRRDYLMKQFTHSFLTKDEARELYDMLLLAPPSEMQAARILMERLEQEFGLENNDSHQIKKG